VEFLKRFSFFSKIPKKFLIAIIHNTKIENYNKGNIIYKEGDEADKLYMIKEGEVVLTKIISINHEVLTVLG
jgi:signal-transduction protein with cAMP-binding, CBS, and nucleotidyltransferase domain